MEKVLIFDVDKCTGCRVCELVCSMAKQGEFNPKKSHIRILKNKEMDTNIAVLGTRCDFCNECTEWCLTQAIKFVSLEEAVVKWKGIKVGSLPAPLVSNL